MSEKQTCCGDAKTMLVVACSGASNVGQIANRVMVEVARAGAAKGFCLAGIGAGLSGFVESAKAGNMILVDGCPVGCGRKVLEKCGVEPLRYFVVTEFGIEKGGKTENLELDVQLALGQVLSNI
jgi:uncharacterized metal-binding protein